MSTAAIAAADFYPPPPPCLAPLPCYYGLSSRVSLRTLLMWAGIRGLIGNLGGRHIHPLLPHFQPSHPPKCRQICQKTEVKLSTSPLNCQSKSGEVSPTASNLKLVSCNCFRLETNDYRLKTIPQTSAYPRSSDVDGWKLSHGAAAQPKQSRCAFREPAPTTWAVSA